jgi:ADP-ribose pyrophosphatase
LSLKFTILNRKAVYQGYFRLDLLEMQHEAFDGTMSGVYTREIFDRGRVAAVLPYDPIRDEVVLNRQFRPAVASTSDQDAWMIEIVAGTIDGSESPEHTALREAKEEAGCTLLDIYPIAAYYPTPGVLSEHMSLFVGQVSTADMPLQSFHGLADENEHIEATIYSVKDALALLETGNVRNGVTIIALQWLALNHQKIRARWLAS